MTEHLMRHDNYIKTILEEKMKWKTAIGRLRRPNKGKSRCLVVLGG